MGNENDKIDTIDEAVDAIKRNAIGTAVEWLTANAKVLGVIGAVVAFVNLGAWQYAKSETETFCNTLFPPSENHITLSKHYAAVASAETSAAEKCDGRVMRGAEKCAAALAELEAACNECAAPE